MTHPPSPLIVTGVRLTGGETGRQMTHPPSPVIVTGVRLTGGETIVTDVRLTGGETPAKEEEAPAKEQETLVCLAGAFAAPGLVSRVSTGASFASFVPAAGALSWCPLSPPKEQ